MMKISFTVLCYLITIVVKPQASIFSDVYFHEIKARHAKMRPAPIMKLCFGCMFHCLNRYSGPSGCLYNVLKP